MWQHRGQSRPSFADEPGPGQESVWDYPRPPALVADAREVRVMAGARLVARTASALRILETASPPTFYLPPEAIDWALLKPAAGQSWCEWKGAARYWSVLAGDEVLERVAWSYPEPRPAFAAIASYVAFYPDRLQCYVDDERVRPQPGGFYGGWVTDEIVGPCKGEAGTGHW